MAAAPGEAAAESVVQMKFRSSGNREGPTVANAATGDCGLEIARLNYMFQRFLESIDQFDFAHKRVGRLRGLLFKALRCYASQAAKSH